VEQQVAADLVHDDPIAVARQLLPLIREHAAETERGRKLAAPVVDALRAAGLFSMGVPASLGGRETPFARVLQTIEELSYADGATGWNVMIAFDSGLMAAHLSAAKARLLVASIPHAIIAGSVAPTGQIQRADGGFRLTGRWPFGSGCQQADIFILGALLLEKGAPVIGANGIPEMMEVAVPAADVKILDTWRVAGLRGTGSHDFAIDNLFVADGFVQPMNFGAPVDKGALYEFPTIASFAVAKAAVALGIARHAIDALKDLARTKVPTGQMSPLRERPTVNVDVAHAEAIVHSARAFLHQTVDEVLQIVASGNAVAQSQLAMLRLAAVDAVQRCAKAVDLMYNAGGASAIYESSELERCFRDAHVATAHVVVQPAVYEAAGRVLMDLPPGTMVW
jgi:indole-3-acetate monooxygenase